MLSTYLIIMGIVAGVITFAWAIGQVAKIVSAFEDYYTNWEKFASILNLLAILTMGSAVVVLFFTVSGLLK